MLLGRLFLLLTVASNVWAFSCRNVHQWGQMIALEKNLEATSLTYAPSLLTTDEKVQSFPNHVLVEVFASGARVPKMQNITPYYDEANGLTLPFGKTVLHEFGLDLFYERFAKNFGSDLRRSVSKAEGRLTLDRQALVTVTNQKLKRRRGFIRIFNGSIYSTGLRATTSLRLPLETELRMAGKTTSAVDELRRKGFDVHEIGKYVLDEPTAEELARNPEVSFSAAEAALVKRDLYLWMMNYLETFTPAEREKSFYFAHVSSNNLMIHYKRTFHLQPVARELSQGLGQNENLMSIRGDQLYLRLNELVQSIETQFNH